MGLLRFFAAATMFCVAVTLQLLGCALYDNWWPMLQYICLLLAPIPLLFFSPGALTGGGGAHDGGGWEDVGKFLLGFTGVGILAVPSILLHAKAIELGAYLLEVSPAPPRSRAADARARPPAARTR